MKSKVSTWFKKRLYSLSLLKAFGGDCLRYARHGASPFRTPTREQLQAIVIMACHQLEKGMSLKNPRPGYGQEAAAHLLANAETYAAIYGTDWLTGVVAGTWQAYVDFNRQLGAEVEPTLAGRSRRFLARLTTAGGTRAGFRQVEKKDVLAKANIDLQGFYESRFSVRNFAPEGVDRSLIEKAVDLARKTPSSCNRQEWKAYAFYDRQTKDRLLELQNGHRGFGEQIAVLLLLTADLQGTNHVKQRNQAWIDGGMFAMSLVYALHSLGLGTCCMNLCHNRRTDRRIRSEAGIPDAEVMLMMVAVGHLPDTFRVAYSPRKPLADVLVQRG